MFTPANKPGVNTAPETISTHRNQLLLPLSVVGVLSLPPFVVFNLFAGNRTLSAAIFVVTLVFFLNSYALYRKKKPPIAFELLLIPGSAAIVLSTVYQGIYGTYWCYPLLLYFFFVVSRRMANACSGLLGIVVTVIVSAYIGLEVASRFAVSYGLLLVLANIIVGVIDELYGKLHEESIKDPLTGAFNRRYMVSRLSEAVAQKHRQAVLPSVLALDMDFFKKVNDELGHAAGDEALKALVKLITERVRQSDKLFRVGGEEFLLLLPDTSEEAALSVAETIRRMVAETELVPGRRLTISIGVSQLDRSETVDDWIKSADDALYRAKSEGRDRVVLRARYGGGAGRPADKKRPKWKGLRLKMKYAAFLRGVNVGGRTSVKMERLREVFAALGFENVKTYIQSGNVVFETRRTDDRRLAEKIEAAVEREFFKTPVMVRPLDEIRAAVANNPFAGEEFDDRLLHLVFLSEALTDEKAAMLLAHNGEKEKFAVRGREVYCLLKEGVADSLLGKKYIDTKLKTPATARNWRTIKKIIEF